MNPLLYSAIPKYLLRGTILDIGCGDCTSQLKSRHRERFISASKEGRYLGIDINPSSRLNTISKDLFTLSTRRTYDLVLLVEVAEHINEVRWSEMFNIIRGLVSPNGSLIVSVPYKEPRDSGMTNPNDVCPHVVFGIDVKKMRSFLPNATVSYHGRGTTPKRTRKDIINLIIHVLRRNPLVNPKRPVWMVLTWNKET
jgi:SAM-dependent methyltransferase